MTSRRLAAILAADVVGYSRMMERDEEGTLAWLQELRKNIIEPTVAGHRGRVVKTTGDGFLVEFASPVEAVRCAVAVQEQNGERRQVDGTDGLLRIGVNLGDVIVEREDLYGDGVNVASRLEGLAEPGGICVSRSVRDQVRDKLPVQLEDRGEVMVKNITRPVRVFAIGSTTPKAITSARERQVLALPDKPSIAVLPFTNMSGDPEQEYFADGMTEEIITALSRLRWLFVIARNSTFTYKGRAVDVKQAGRELGVRYVVEGSVRKAGTRVRITGQLIEAATANHLWADRLEGEIDDIFSLQDRVTATLVAAIEPSLKVAETQRVRSGSTENLHAYDQYLKALWHYYRLTESDIEKAIDLLQRSLERDPEFYLARALAAHCYWICVLQNFGDGAVNRQRACEHARSVLAHPREDPWALALAGLTILHAGFDYNAALAAVDRAATLSPHSAHVRSCRAWVHARSGDWQTAVDEFLMATRLNPLDPEIGWSEIGLCLSYLRAGDYETGLRHARRAVSALPAAASGRRVLIASLVLTGGLLEAKKVLADLLQLVPGSSLMQIEGVLRDIRDEAFRRTLLDALRKAGVPEG
jgi:adenylate cyclase